MQKYELKITCDDHGELVMNSQNEGFSPFELLGLITWKQQDIIKQIGGEIKPDVVTRKVAKEDKP